MVLVDLLRVDVQRSPSLFRDVSAKDGRKPLPFATKIAQAAAITG
jgi:hypothetical protein